MGSNTEKKWILEFLLRQPIEDHDMIHLLSSLTPTCHQDHNLTKTLLLRRISSQIQNGSISHQILESLELIEEIDHKKGSIKTSDSMKEAYYAVLIHCAKKDNIMFWNSWRGRLRDMERGIGVGLVSDQLNDLRKRIDDSGVSEKKDSKSVAMAMIRKFLEEARDEMGPSFLDMAAKIVRESEEAQGLNESIIANEVEVRHEDTIVATNENVDTNHNDMSGNLDVGVCDGKRREKDVSGNLERESGERVVLEDNQVVRCDDTRNQAARQSLMERNSTAHAYRWEDDNIGSSSEGSANPQPPTVHKSSVSSLRKRPAKNPIVRRKKRNWSSIEEHTLYDAVKEYGVGNWALILRKNREIFEDRQPGDLKDKWRNLTK